MAFEVVAKQSSGGSPTSPYPLATLHKDGRLSLNPACRKFIGDATHALIYIDEDLTPIGIALSFHQNPTNSILKAAYKLTRLTGTGGRYIATRVIAKALEKAGTMGKGYGSLPLHFQLKMNPLTKLIVLHLFTEVKDA